MSANYTPLNWADFSAGATALDAENLDYMEAGIQAVDTAAQTAAANAQTAGVNAAATAQGFAIQRANHTGTQSADTLVDGATNKVFTAALAAKLASLDPTLLLAIATLGTPNGPAQLDSFGMLPTTQMPVSAMVGVMLIGTGVPSSAVGLNGMGFFAQDTGITYTKSGGAWTAGTDFAVDANVVHTSGTETVAGVKTLTGLLNANGGISTTTGTAINVNGSMRTFNEVTHSSQTFSATGAWNNSAKYVVFTGTTASQTLTSPTGGHVGQDYVIVNTATVAVTIAAGSGQTFTDGTTAFSLAANASVGINYLTVTSLMKHSKSTNA